MPCKKLSEKYVCLPFKDKAVTLISKEYVSGLRIYDCRFTASQNVNRVFLGNNSDRIRLGNVYHIFNKLIEIQRLILDSDLGCFPQLSHLMDKTLEVSVQDQCSHYVHRGAMRGKL